jgi:hypothetical protein
VAPLAFLPEADSGRGRRWLQPSSATISTVSRAEVRVTDRRRPVMVYGVALEENGHDLGDS